MMRFRYFIETNVKDWQWKINKAAIGRKFAFKDWFPPEGRIYIPFQQEHSEIEKNIKDFFEDHPEYQLVDYKQGLAKDKYNRLVRIGKVIAKTHSDNVKEIENELAQNKISQIKFRNELNHINSYYQGLLKTFESSPGRVGSNQSNFMIVFSSTPEDIAGMSTNRDWTSCMNLQGGSNNKSVWCEIKNGGFVAYLCKASDKNIDKPLARIHIRRFDNNEGKSIAIPEETAYGNEIDGFYENVLKWLESKQGKLNPGMYIRRGGSYSDTFGSATDKRNRRESMLHPILPESPKRLLKVVNRYMHSNKIQHKNLYLMRLTNY